MKDKKSKGKNIFGMDLNKIKEKTDNTKSLEGWRKDFDKS